MRALAARVGSRGSGAAALRRRRRRRSGGAGGALAPAIDAARPPAKPVGHGCNAPSRSGERPRPRLRRSRPRAGSSSRSARRCSSTTPAATSAGPGSTRWPRTSRAAARAARRLLIVSSGAIAVGRRHLGLTGRALRLEEKQAAAATGQIRLAHAYQEALARHGITVAQILLTPDDTEERRRHLNARATLDQLLALGAVPVINENDTVATAEIRFGDNDRLAARVAQMISADMLVLLSDIDGLYTADPRRDPAARHIPVVREITAGDRGDGRRGARPATARAAW